MDLERNKRARICRRPLPRNKLKGRNSMALLALFILSTKHPLSFGGKPVNEHTNRNVFGPQF